MDDHPTRRFDPTAPPEEPGATRRLDPAAVPPAAAAIPRDEKGRVLRPDRPCVRCGGTVVATRAIAQGGVFLRRVFGFLHGKNSGVRAWVCTTCGYTELYATNPANLREP
jgi:predicted nucleic-acid-binding Zn-ribbon protein